jgi:diguanylate cyclase (GGDEF)-like protein/PAS domain S-box-containing protein
MTGQDKKNEYTAGETAAWYKDLVDNARDLIQCVDSEGKFIFVNQAWLLTLGYAAEEIDNITLWDIIHPDSMEHCMAVFEQVLTGKTCGEVEAIFVTKGGTPVMVEGHVGVKLDEKGRFVHTRGIFRDVTEHKQAEQALRKTQFTMDKSPLSVFWISPEGKFTYVNETAAEKLGYSREELLSMHIWDVDPHYPQERRKEQLNLYREKGGVSFESEHRRRDGTTFPVQINSCYLAFEGQEIEVAEAADITERKRAEEALQESEEKYRRIADNASDVIWITDMTLNVTYVSPSVERMVGESVEEHLKKNLEQKLPPQALEQIITVFQEEIEKESDPSAEKNRTRSIEVEHYKADGKTIWLAMHISALRDEAGNMIGFQGISRDITDRKQAEEALKASEEKYREILSAIEEGYYEVDLAGNFVFFNDSFCKVLGYNRDELMQTSYKKIYKNPKDVLQTFNRVYRTGVAEKAADWPAITQDGREIFIEVSITLRRDEAGNPIGFRGITRDVTERKLAEEKLREYEKLQQLLMNMATDLINVPLKKVDQAINEMLEAVGDFTKVDRVYIFMHDNDRRLTSNTYEWCAEGITPEIDSMQDFPLEQFADFLEAHQKGEIVHIPDVARMPESHAMRPVLEAQDIQSLILLPLFSEDVNIGFVGFDVVKQKKTFTEQEIDLLIVLAEITSNILARQKTESNIRYISFHDQLTGLYNRHFLEVEMERLDTARQLPLTVIMADLNGLKLVNDTYGHDTGDELLKTAATIIRNSCREEDIISRWGGDEFVILLPQTTGETARLICQRIAESCSGAFVEDVPVSIALGIATKTLETTSLIETLQEAENEMYRHKLTESRSTKSAVVTSLLNTLAAKSFETEEHTRGMQKIAQQIGAKLGLPDSELHRLDLLITLHDIGKINISEAILTKNSSLTDDEWKAIKKHPEIGYRIAMATEEFAHVAEDILAHHERWDGAGYPQGLKGSSISLPARIVAVADAYEVMSHGRPYKKAMSKNEIITEFKRCSGTQFDPELVEILLSILEAAG